MSEPQAAAPRPGRPTTVLVVRHGQSEGNVSRNLSAAVPGSPLTDAGRRQAAEAAVELAGRGVSVVYTSPLLRAQQTAAIIADGIGVDQVLTLAEVREFDLGDCEGSDTEEFLSVLGADLGPLVRGRLGLPDREFLVLREWGRAIGCARLLDLAGTTYGGGVTVLPGRRGEGLGRLVSALATRRALQRSPLAWLHCADDPAWLSTVYAGLGYRRVTTHAHLAPATR